MNPFALSCLLAFISSLALGIFSWVKGKKFLNKIWAIFNLAVAIWGLGGFKFSTTLNQEAVFFWLRFGHVGVTLIPILFIHFVFEFLEIKKPKVLFTTYATGLIFFTLNLTDWLGVTKVFIVSLRYVFNSFYVDSPPPLLYVLFVVFYFWTVGYAHYYGIKYLRLFNGARRKQLKYFLLATSLGYIGGWTTFLPVFNIDLYPIGHFTVFLYSIIMTYAIFKYKLMDINLVFRKGFIYSLFVSAISVVYLIVVSLVEHSFKIAFGYRSISATLLALSVVALLSQPIKNRIQYFVDLHFFRGTAESLAEQNRLLQGELLRTEKLKMAGALAASVAHEIKNPLTSIKTFTSYLPERHQEKAFVEKFKVLVCDEVGRIERLCRDLLDFAKPKPTKSEKVDVHQILDKTLGLIEHDLTMSNIKPIRSYYKL